MRHFVSAVCCLIVGLQVLIGVPLVVCVVFHVLAAGEAWGPVSVEYQTGHGGSPTTIPPPNRIPAAIESTEDNPILQSRVERGSPLAGTVLESGSLEEEQNLFVAAVEKAAAESTSEPANKPAIAPAQTPTAEHRRELANQFAVGQLYAIADVDEQAGDFERADQWRALAREIRSQTSTIPAGDTGAAETLTNRPAIVDAPF